MCITPGGINPRGPRRYTNTDLNASDHTTVKPHGESIPFACQPHCCGSTDLPQRSFPPSAQRPILSSWSSVCRCDAGFTVLFPSHHFRSTLSVCFEPTSCHCKLNRCSCRLHIRLPPFVVKPRLPPKKIGQISHLATITFHHGLPLVRPPYTTKEKVLYHFRCLSTATMFRFSRSNSVQVAVQPAFACP